MKQPYNRAGWPFNTNWCLDNCLFLVIKEEWFTSTSLQRVWYGTWTDHSQTICPWIVRMAKWMNEWMLSGWWLSVEVLSQVGWFPPPNNTETEKWERCSQTWIGKDEGRREKVNITNITQHIQTDRVGIGRKGGWGGCEWMKSRERWDKQEATGWPGMCSS